MTADVVVGGRVGDRAMSVHLVSYLSLILSLVESIVAVRTQGLMTSGFSFADALSHLVYSIA